MVESNKEKNFVSLTKLDAVLVSPRAQGREAGADSYQQKHKVLLSPSGKYEFIPRSAEPPRLDANNLVSGSDRTKRTHASLFTVLRGEIRTSS